MIGYITGFLLFGYSNLTIFIMLGMFTLSIGEISHTSVNVRFIPEIAPKGLLGRYLGLSGIQELGPFIFNLFGGLIINKYGGKLLFSIAALASLIAGILKYISNEEARKKIYS